MKNILLKYCTVTVFILSFVSCNDFLTENNPNQLSPDAFWTSIDNCNIGLTAVYQAFKNPNVLNIMEESKRSDLVYPGQSRPNSGDQYYNKTFSDASPVPNSKWDALYQGVFRANQVIIGVGKLIPTLTTQSDQVKAKEILAQAKFFRGLFYFYLYNSFNHGSVILYDFVPENESDFYKNVSPATDVESFFVADLDSAYHNLPAKWSSADNLGRVTAGAAAAILGQHYLYKKDYDKGVTYLKDVITNTNYGYALTPSIGDNFTTKSEFNSESILEIGFSTNYLKQISPWDNNTVTSILATALSPMGGWKSLYPSLWLIDAYRNEKIDPMDARNWVEDANAIGGKRIRKFSLRTSYSILLPDDQDLPYYLQPINVNLPSLFANKEGAIFRKYTNWDIVSTETDIFPLQRSGINVRVLRLADVYLMYAECMIKGGTDESGVAEATKYINKVRQRSALLLIGKSFGSEFFTATHDELDYSAASLMQHLMYIERPLELSIEGQATRVIDMRRWGISKQRYAQLAQQTYYLTDYVYLSPKGVSSTANKCIVLNTKPAAGVPNVALTDFTLSATNYNEAAHDYWPIPNNETVANPSVK